MQMKSTRTSDVRREKRNTLMRRRSRLSMLRTRELFKPAKGEEDLPRVNSRAAMKRIMKMFSTRLMPTPNLPEAAANPREEAVAVKRVRSISPTRTSQPCDDR